MNPDSVEAVEHRPATPLALAALLAIAAIASGCATTPATAIASTPAAINDCGQLGAEIARAKEARDGALEKQQHAWKAVIPFAVAARYAGGKADASAATERLRGLEGEFDRKGCAR